MKIKRNFVNTISLDKVPDAADNSRIAISTGAQTIDGEKTFTDIRVPSSVAGQDKTLINLDDLETALDSSNPLYVNEIITLTYTNINDKSATLRNTASSGFAKIKTQSSTWFLRGQDFTITNKILSWSGSAELEAKLQVGDELYVRYTI